MNASRLEDPMSKCLDSYQNLIEVSRDVHECLGSIIPFLFEESGGDLYKMTSESKDKCRDISQLPTQPKEMGSNDLRMKIFEISDSISEGARLLNKCLGYLPEDIFMEMVERRDHIYGVIFRSTT